MPLARLNTKQVTGQYFKADGTPASGSVSFALKRFVQSLNNADLPQLHIVIPVARVANLDAQGKFVIDLVLSSDDDYAPATTYLVTESVQGFMRDPFEIILDETSPEMIDLIAQGPINPPSPTAAYLTMAVADLRYHLKGEGGVGIVSWVDITNKPTTFPPQIGSLATQAVAGNDTRLANQRTPTDGSVTNAKVATGAAIDLSKLAVNPLARSTHTGTQTAASISDLAEAVQDLVASFLVAGNGVTVSYNDTANTFTINATASGTGETDAEVVRDTIGGALVAGGGIQITVNDAGNTITIASTAVLPTRAVNTGTGLAGGGDLSTNRTLSVNFGTTAGTVVQGNDSRITSASQEGHQHSTGDISTEDASFTTSHMPAGYTLDVHQADTLYGAAGSYPDVRPGRPDQYIHYFGIDVPPSSIRQDHDTWDKVVSS